MQLLPGTVAATPPCKCSTGLIEAGGGVAQLLRTLRASILRRDAGILSL
jgi:hypothetical protein